MDFQRWDLLTNNPMCFWAFPWRQYGDLGNLLCLPFLKPTVRTRKLWLQDKPFLTVGALCLFSGAMLVLGSVIAVPLIGMHCYIMTIPIYRMISHVNLSIILPVLGPTLTWREHIVAWYQSGILQSSGYLKVVPFSVIVAWCVDRGCCGRLFGWDGFSSRLGRCKWASFHAKWKFGCLPERQKVKVILFDRVKPLFNTILGDQENSKTSAKGPEEHPNTVPQKMKQYEATTNRWSVFSVFFSGPLNFGMDFFTREGPGVEHPKPKPPLGFETLLGKSKRPRPKSAEKCGDCIRGINPKCPKHSRLGVLVLQTFRFRIFVGTK